VADAVREVAPFVARVCFEEILQVGVGRLLGVSAQTIYNWEHEVARPRTEQLGKLAALRGIGKREAGERLKQLVATSRKPRGTE
jgi:transcriptional regulator with XRE-family HTH domain